MIERLPAVQLAFYVVADKVNGLPGIGPLLIKEMVTFSSGFISRGFLRG
jgi:hypothetical protein